MKLTLKEGKDYTIDTKTSVITFSTRIPNGIYVTTYDTIEGVTRERGIKKVRVDVSLGDYLAYVFNKWKNKALHRIRLKRITKGVSE